MTVRSLPGSLASQLWPLCSDNTASMISTAMIAYCRHELSMTGRLLLGLVEISAWRRPGAFAGSL